MNSVYQFPGAAAVRSHTPHCSVMQIYYPYPSGGQKSEMGLMGPNQGVIGASILLVVQRESIPLPFQRPGRPAFVGSRPLSPRSGDTLPAPVSAVASPPCLGCFYLILARTLVISLGPRSESRGIPPTPRCLIPSAESFLPGEEAD